MHNLFLLLLLPSVVFGAKAPNFVIIYADDLGYSQLSVPMMKGKPEYAHSRLRYMKRQTVKRTGFKN